jgi:hypothetical protein
VAIWRRELIADVSKTWPLGGLWIPTIMNLHEFMLRLKGNFPTVIMMLIKL